MFSLIFILWLLYIVYALLVGNIKFSFLCANEKPLNRSESSVERDLDESLSLDKNMFTGLSQRHLPFNIHHNDGE